MPIKAAFLHFHQLILSAPLEYLRSIWIDTVEQEFENNKKWFQWRTKASSQKSDMTAKISTV